MKMLATLFAGAALATAGGAAAQSADEANKADLMCFSIYMVTAGQIAEDSPDQAGLAAGGMYFLGKLTGRSPDVDWLERMGELLDVSTFADLDQHRSRCADEMMVTGQALIDWGDAFEE